MPESSIEKKKGRTPFVERERKANEMDKNEGNTTTKVLMWIGVMTPFSHFGMTESDLIQRTPHVHVQSECYAHTSAVKSTVLQVYAAPILSQVHRQGSAGSMSGFWSKPPVATITHVPSRAMCRAAPVPTGICFCTRFAASAVSPQDLPRSNTRRQVHR